MEIYGLLAFSSSKECPHCFGAGGWFEEDFDPTFEIDSLWVDCPICGSKGSIHVQPCSNEEEVNHDCA